MSKAIPDVVLDKMLDYIALGNLLTLCSAEPTTYGQATTLSAYKLAEVTVDPSDFSKADHATSGRELTVAAKTGVPAGVAGTANHVAIVKTGTTELLYVTTIPDLVMAFPSDVNIDAFTIQAGDPT